MLQWIIAFLITVGAVYYQRTTGPTYPVEASAPVGGRLIHAELLRTHAGPGDQPVVAEGVGPETTGRLIWRRYPTSEVYRSIEMVRDGDRLTARLPHQPPAGKLEYRLEVTDGPESASLPADRTVVTRFKGHVPPGVLVPHVFFIFVAMLFSNRTALEALRRGERMRIYTWWTVGFLLLGGMIFGPIVQKYAFGALWTGVPFGWDLTDNKTLIAFAAWLVALMKMRGRGHPRWWIVGAAVVTFVIFAIPHSVLGSEIKYE